nr:MAG TPA: hypothetical protein [Caudoviricetes sp.]
MWADTPHQPPPFNRPETHRGPTSSPEAGPRRPQGSRISRAR